MAWLAVDEDKDEWLYMQQPERFGSCFDTDSDDCQLLEKGTIKRLIGRNLTWDNAPVEI